MHLLPTRLDVSHPLQVLGSKERKTENRRAANLSLFKFPRDSQRQSHSASSLRQAGLKASCSMQTEQQEKQSDAE